MAKDVKTFAEQKDIIRCRIAEIHDELDRVDNELDQAQEEGNDNWIVDLETEKELLEGELSQLNDELDSLRKYPDRILPHEETFETKLDDLGESPDY